MRVEIKVYQLLYCERKLKMNIYIRLLEVKGAGGVPVLGMVKSIFLLFLIEGSPSYQMLFTGSKNIGPSQSYRIFKS